MYDSTDDFFDLVTQLNCRYDSLRTSPSSRAQSASVGQRLVKDIIWAIHGSNCVTVSPASWKDVAKARRALVNMKRDLERLNESPLDSIDAGQGSVANTLQETGNGASVQSSRSKGPPTDDETNEWTLAADEGITVPTKLQQRYPSRLLHDPLDLMNAMKDSGNVDDRHLRSIVWDCCNEIVSGMREAHKILKNEVDEGNRDAVIYYTADGKKLISSFREKT
jgi:hypothetical protein